MLEMKPHRNQLGNLPKLMGIPVPHIALRCLIRVCDKPSSFNLTNVLIYVMPTRYNMAPYSCVCSEMSIDEVSQKHI